MTNWKFGPGRPGWKHVAELNHALDVRSLHRAGTLTDGSVAGIRWKTTPSGEISASARITVAPSSIGVNHAVGFEPSSQRISLLRTNCNFGGTRVWFACPRCGGRYAVLYAPDGRFACRHCQRIAYQSQSEDLNARLYRKENKIRERLGPTLARRKGMHSSTHKRLLDAFDQLSERQIDPGFARAWERIARSGD